MKKDFKPIKLNKVRSNSLKDRQSKVSIKSFGKAYTRSGNFSEFLNCLPDILAAKDLKEVVTEITTAYKAQKIIVLAIGAHVIKVGLNPIIIDLMEKGIISAIALNGAGPYSDSTR